MVHGPSSDGSWDEWRDGSRRSSPVGSPDRREFLKGIGACVTPLLGPFDTTGTASTDGLVDESRMTERRVDVSPGQEVAGIVDNVRSGELLVFPSGTFSWSDHADVYLDDWGIRCQPDTVFEVPAGFGDGTAEHLLRTAADGDGADNFLLENLTFDSPGRAAPGLRLGVRNRARVDGLHYQMNGPVSNRTHENGLSAKVTNGDGELVINDYRQFNNGDLGGYADGDSRIGVFVGRGHRGTVRLVNPVLQGFPNNACYVSRQRGDVFVEGGLLANNNVSAVRVSGGVEVRDTTILIDTDRYVEGPGRIEGPTHNTRGVWGDTRERGETGGTVSGVSFVLASYRDSQGLATILENPFMSLEDCQFLLDADIEAVVADDGEILVLGCTFDGSSTGSTAGTGDITGLWNHVNPDIDPGALSADSTGDYAFDWSRTHPETPGRPTGGSHSDRLLEIRTPESTDWMTYTFTATGTVVKATHAGDDDRISENDDGTWTVTGILGRGGTDSYEFDGKIQSWSADYEADAYTLLLDGTEVTVDELTAA